MWLARVVHNSRMFGQFANPEAILATIMTGRLYRLDAITSLRSFHNIKGKQTMSAALMVGIIQRSPRCEYFRPIETTVERATWETKRRCDPPVKLSYTIEQAKRAGLVTKGGNWEARPDTDDVAGLYSSEEMQDVAG
jgi:hypothetical protein